MKTMLKLYVYIMYVIGFPFFLVFTIGMLIYSCIRNLKDFGEMDIKESIEAFFAGVKEGHQINMARVEYVAGENEDWAE